MNKIILAALLIGLAACQSKKTESTNVTDSLTMDTSILAEKPTIATLSFSPIDGFSLNNKTALEDTVNFFILSNQEELNGKFIDKQLPDGMKPDFLINYIVAVGCTPSPYITSIAMDKVEISDRDINVYLNITKGDKQASVTKSSQIFAIEKRDGYVGMQFFINGKKDKAFILPMN